MDNILAYKCPYLSRNYSSHDNPRVLEALVKFDGKNFPSEVICPLYYEKSSNCSFIKDMRAEQYAEEKKKIESDYAAADDDDNPGKAYEKISLEAKARFKHPDMSKAMFNEPKNNLDEYIESAIEKAKNEELSKLEKRCKAEPCDCILVNGFKKLIIT